DNHGALFDQNVNRIRHDFGLLRIEPVVKRDAWNADASPFQPVTFEESSVIPAGRRHTDPGCRIIRVRRSALHGTEHYRGVCHCFRHWPRCVLVRSDGDYAITADAADCWLDSD